MRLTHRDDPETGDFPGERVFASKVDVKYVLEEGTGRPATLAIGFSGRTPPGSPPHYHWHRLLDEFAVNRLFVLDDQGPGDPPRANWYLGHGRSPAMPDSVCELIEGIVSELGVARGNVVTVGSSMGAWAALYFGARIGARHTIVAEPQVLLGSYLDMPKLHPIAAHIAGGTSPDDIDYLDAILFDALRAAESLPQVHILCGRTSPYMERHVQPLVALLDELGCSYQVTLGRNSKHSHVPVEFAWFLRTRLGEITSARESEVGSHP